MNDPRSNKNPTVRIGIFIVVVVLLVIATLLYNAISEKREYDRANAPASVAPAAASVATAASAASASQ
ncbi:hypothetical protein FAZ69_18870 [Trinickia terrae]|uniref:Uncharacterized protein n=1 Tax=Trinickia terrae TaxID=2571161 RepID=A0A4U1I0R5_9BURK|nr:hypothetical protein [Trinickia terrae]TKC86717.1 hypothetical protein FAZ69_18870 [Trinickia terrae]